MYEPVLRGAVVLPDSRLEERFRGEPRQEPHAPDTHHRRAQLPGEQHDAFWTTPASCPLWLWLNLRFVLQFFALKVYSSDGAPLTAEQLCLQLERICSASPPSDAQPVGILTTQHRDSWGRVYADLIKGESLVHISKLQEYLSKLCFRIRDKGPACFINLWKLYEQILAPSFFILTGSLTTTTDSC